MFVLSRKKEKRRVSAGTLRSIMQKLVKVEAGNGTEFMPDCFFETKCEGGEPETKFFDANTNEPIKQWSWPEPPDDNAFTNYGSLDEFVANNSQKVFRIVDRNK